MGKLKKGGGILGGSIIGGPLGALFGGLSSKFHVGASTKDILDPLHIGTSVKKSLGLQEQKVPPVTALPDEQALATARRRRLAQILQRGGRESTIMSDQTLGG